MSTRVNLQSAQHSWDEDEEDAREPASRGGVAKRKQPVVKDSWDDDDDDEEEDERDQDPQKIWHDANKAAPMPEILHSNTSSTSASIPPPATAFQPALRILKRPSSVPPSTNTSPSSQPTAQILAEKEARYQAARERIFGLGGSASADVGATFSADDEPESGRGTESSGRQKPASPTVVVKRAPRGPGERAGFGERTRGSGAGNTDA